MGATPAALDLELFKDLTLEGVGLDGKGCGDRIVVLASRRLSEVLSLERFEVGIGPVGLEDPVEGVDQVGIRLL